MSNKTISSFIIEEKRIKTSVISALSTKMHCFIFLAVTGMKCSYGNISSPLTEIPVGKTEISVTEPGRPLIWTHQSFYKGFRGKVRSRKPGQPGQPGSYEKALRRTFYLGGMLTHIHLGCGACFQCWGLAFLWRRRFTCYISIIGRHCSCFCHFSWHVTDTDFYSYKYLVVVGLIDLYTVSFVVMCRN